MTLPTLLIRDIPAQERPRERLLKEGAKALTNKEILAILLRSGTKKESALQLAGKLLVEFDGLTLLRTATIEELCKINGIGIAKAVEIQAVMEIGRRMHTLPTEEKYVIRSPEDVSNYVMEDMRFLTQEHFIALYLNTKNHVLHRHTLFIGSLNASIVHPREVFKEALRRSAASVICLHNHPSGDPTPSREDIEVTKRLNEAGKVLGVELLDHVIIGDRQFISLKEQGHII
ncbi:DNA repair protein RadC [Alkalihalophilus lindianensis]|uniref:DNA repair protein RadC n=1 Tax=Alkalihalophilus lindianensis TaxID=1630542 RepID=A0ABU3XAI6_9BACI|nr:DNA repair protein RadC [Alkalihalophilus lindianensis]MDV2684900.1 DNA repair protein RadC [Alkalihalophilus lindianensis]